MKAYKTFVPDEEVHRQLVEKCIRLGYQHGSSVEDDPFMFFSEDMIFSSMSADRYEFFKDHEYEYISAKDFLALPEPVHKKYVPGKSWIVKNYKKDCSVQHFDLQPFERVLVRDTDYQKWICNFYSHLHVDGMFFCVGSVWTQIARYEGNEHYLRTTDDIPGAWKA